MKNVTTTFNSNHLYLAVDGSNMGWNHVGDIGYAVVGMKGRKVYNILSAPAGKKEVASLLIMATLLL